MVFNYQENESHIVSLKTWHSPSHSISTLTHISSKLCGYHMFSNSLSGEYLVKMPTTKIYLHIRGELLKHQQYVVEHRFVGNEVASSSHECDCKCLQALLNVVLVE
ncbi:hypothetical protein TNCT_716331 [Trichonephila clavata]|uniref:Uncharacterized protein n=1 Tax=Trichonephila clavata TaxID=2740835 RepID=A0A8X6KJ95_TRICU|nr:hypothetical protein TNCT_716331 [Trichonephila clavata]